MCGVRIGHADEPDPWEYVLTFIQDVHGKRPIIRSERVLRRGDEILNRPDEKDRKDPERLTQTNLEQVYTNQAFRELADFLRSVRYLHVVPQLIREPERSVGRTNDPYGGDFLESIAQTPEKKGKARPEGIKELLRSQCPSSRLWNSSVMIGGSLISRESTNTGDLRVHGGQRSLFPTALSA